MAQEVHDSAGSKIVLPAGPLGFVEAGPFSRSSERHSREWAALERRATVIVAPLLNVLSALSS